MNRRAAAGFSLMEMMVSLFILIAVSAAAMKISVFSKASTSKAEVSSRFAYFEDLLLSRGNLIASNLLFWMGNVDFMASNAGKLLHGIGANPTATALIGADFYDPLHFSGHDLYPVSETLVVPTPLVALAAKTWWDTYKTTHSGLNVVAALNRCFLPGSAMTPLTSLVGATTFRFCLALESSEDPVGRQALANGGAATPRFIVASFTVTSRDLFSSLLIPIVDVDHSSGAPPAMKPNRSYEMIVEIASVLNYSDAFAKQTHFVTTRTYVAPKQTRMLINCGHCLNSGDPAFVMQCPATIAAGCVL